MAWITPITDRTIDDVAYARANQHLDIDLKGAWNVSDANRVINNTIYLRDLLCNMGYIVVFEDQPYISINDLPYITSFMKVLRDNVKAVVDAYPKYGHSPIQYTENFGFTNANNIELNLKLTNQLLENMIAALQYSGQFASGFTSGLRGYTL